MGVSTEVVVSTYSSTHGHSVQPQEVLSNKSWEPYFVGGSKAWLVAPVTMECTWHSHRGPLALVQNDYPLSRAEVISTDILGFPEK